MTLVAFVSAVSDEFHHADIQRPALFDSYRDVLARSLRILVEDCTVTTQEDLAQGFGDLLATLENEICQSDIIVHLVGDMAGAVPEPASVRRLLDRDKAWLTDEPELAEAIGDGTGISYTQWEGYLAFQHRCGRLIFVLDSEAPRSPKFRVDAEQRASQQAHMSRLQRTGEHYETCYDQYDLARKSVASIERFGGSLRSHSISEPVAGRITGDEAAEVAFEIGTALRELAKDAITELDPAGIEAFLSAIDTAALQRELDRRTALQVVYDHRTQVRQTVAVDPSTANLYELAFAELALAHYLEAKVAADHLAGKRIELIASDADRAEQHRDKALNALLLSHQAARMSGRREDAINALEKAGQLIDVDLEPILWAEIHEVLAEYLLDHAQFDRAEPLIYLILDIREDHQGEDDPALPASLLIWCRLLHARSQYQNVVDVAARAARLFGRQQPPSPMLSSAFSWQAGALISSAGARTRNICTDKPWPLTNWNTAPIHRPWPSI